MTACAAAKLLAEGHLDGLGHRGCKAGDERLRGERAQLVERRSHGRSVGLGPAASSNGFHMNSRKHLHEGSPR
jgi:hypothetical protein